jgi:exportin-7
MGNSTMSIAGTVVSVVGMGGSGMSSSRLSSHDSAPSIKQKVYQRMFEHLGMGDHSAVSNLIVTKIGNNLKYWAEEQEIVGKTLELLLDMASGYSSSKLLLTLDTVKFLARNHTEDHFPFLALAANVRHRTTFHATLTRLLLGPNGEEKLGLKFDQFMEPICCVLTQLERLATPQELRSEAARRPMIGVFRDLRGITASMHNRKTFSRLFETLYPQHLPFLARVADTWWDQPDVMVSLLKFCLEFCHNKANRINFDQSSANGILLFRTVSDVVCAFGRRLLASGGGNISGAGAGGVTTPTNGNGLHIQQHNNNNGGDSDIYKQRYKGISLALNVLNSALGGNYVCFGVFCLYKDPCLDNALEIALQMTLSIPLEHVLQYPKVSKAYFSFIEILMRNHISTALALDTTIFMQLMSAVHEGLQASDATLSSACANSVDHLATFYFNSHDKSASQASSSDGSSALTSPSAVNGISISTATSHNHINNNNSKNNKDLAEMNLNKHLAAQPNLFSSLTSTIFNLLLFGPPSNHWAVLRPILSLVLADESSFTAYKDYLIQTQNPENQQNLSEAFNKLLADTSRNLESANRERFTQKLTAFRVAARSFLTL